MASEFMRSINADTTDGDVIEFVRRNRGTLDLNARHPEHMSLNFLSFIASARREEALIYIMREFGVKKLEFMEMFYICRLCMINALEYVIENKIEVLLDDSIFRVLAVNARCGNPDTPQLNPFYERIIDRLVSAYPTADAVKEYTADREGYTDKCVASFKKFIKQ